MEGDRRANVEQAIELFTAALTRDNSRDQRAVTEANLGRAYMERIAGDAPTNLREAIKHLEAALQVLTPRVTRTDRLERWGKVKNNLGNAYKDLGDLAQAKEHYEAALLVLTKESSPEVWAMLKLNLAETCEDAGEALALYDEALQVFTCKAYPERWATTQYFKGIALSNRGDYAAAAKRSGVMRLVFSRETNPAQFVEASSGLAQALRLQARVDLQRIHDVAVAALDAADDVRAAAISGQLELRRQAKHSAILFSQAIEVCLRLGLHDEALKLLDRSKATALRDLLQRQSTQPRNCDAGLLAQWRAKDEAVGVEQRLLHVGAPEASWPNLRARVAERLQFVEEHIKDKDKEFADRLRPQSLSAAEIKALRAGAVHWFWGEERVVAFVVDPDADGGLRVETVSASPEELAAAIAAVHNAPYATPEGSDELDMAGAIARLSALLQVELWLPPSSELLVFPHRFLWLVPFGALTVSESAPGVIVWDRCEEGVSAAPSAKLLGLLREQQGPGDSNGIRGRLLAVRNPERDLLGAKIEIPALQRARQDAGVDCEHDDVRDAANATRDDVLAAMSQAELLWFACHGVFNSDDPEASALKLADGTKLTVRDLFGAERLERCALAVLSACSSGTVDVSQRSDEFVGLPAGFLAAGASRVLCSLWPVHDGATVLLLRRMATRLLEDGSMTPAHALREAALEVRALTNEQLDSELSALNRSLEPTPVEGPNDAAADDDPLTDVDEYSDDDKPDGGDQAGEEEEKGEQDGEENGRAEEKALSPYLWAAFASVG